MRPIQVTGFPTLPQAQRQQMGQVKPGEQAPEPVRQTLQAQAPKMLACPATARRIRGELVAGLRKGLAQPPEAAKSKVWPFAQDLCIYFVLPTAAKEKPAQEKPAKEKPAAGEQSR